MVYYTETMALTKMLKLLRFVGIINVELVKSIDRYIRILMINNYSFIGM